MKDECKVCGKPDPEHIFHCEDHYLCENCGTKENLITSKQLLCRSCLEKQIEIDIQNFNGNTDYTNDVTCPHCGHEQMDSWEYNSGEYDCGHCEKPFDVEIYTERTYSTTRVES